MFMKEATLIPDIPGYVSIKQTAKLLGISDKRVYQYIEERRLPAVRAGHNIMLPLEAVTRFRPKLTGRPRKGPPPWRALQSGGPLITTHIRVRVRSGQQDNLVTKLHEIKQKELYTFPGTVARYIIQEETSPDTISLSLIWKNKELQNEAEHKKVLEEFAAELDDVLDWSTAQYTIGEAIIHT